MEVSLSQYNAHKRSTLDRITLTYQLRIREALRKNAESIFHEIIDALDNGGKIDFKSATKSVDSILKKNYEAHAEHIIRAGFSDAIQEVTPDKKLYQWANFTLNTPVETTLSIELSDKRSDLIIQYFKDRSKKIDDNLKVITANTKDVYLRSLKVAFSSASKDWFNGEVSHDDVKSLLKRALQVTDSSAERVLRTETTAYFNDTRNSYFRVHTDVDYVEIFAITDGRISHICETRHGFCVPIEKSHLRKYLPPFHPNCRTVQRPLFSFLKSHAEIIKKGLSMNESKFAPLPEGWN